MAKAETDSNAKSATQSITKATNSEAADVTSKRSAVEVSFSSVDSLGAFSTIHNLYFSLYASVSAAAIVTFSYRAISWPFIML